MGSDFRLVGFVARGLAAPAAEVSSLWWTWPKRAMSPDRAPMASMQAVISAGDGGRVWSRAPGSVVAVSRRYSPTI